MVYSTIQYLKKQQPNNVPRCKNLSTSKTEIQILLRYTKPIQPESHYLSAD